ncbi:MAG: FAD:protein FMN transferase [Acutalibacteraceae bacterium]
MKKKKIYTAIVSALCLIAAAVAIFLLNGRNKSFDYSEKSTVSMGTIVTQKVYGEYAGKDIEKINAIINALDKSISWREEDSEVSALNRDGKLSNANLAAMLDTCKQVSRDSGGVFDVTVGGVSRLWSIGEEDERLPGDSEIQTELKNVGYEGISISGNDITLAPGVSLDLGAVGKGAACDMAYNYLKASDAKGAVISVGGSILAYGKHNKAGDKWRIAVRHPRKENEYIGVISLSEGFVSTSGDYERYFEKDGRRYHHIIDATTGYPSDSGLISVTVVCQNGLLSDALSTACFILGEKKSRALLEKYDAAAVFIDSELTISTVGEIEFEKSR